MKDSTRARTILALLVSITLLACSDDGPEAGFGTVVLQFEHTVAGQPMAMNTGTYTNAAGNQYSISKLEYTVSNFSLGTFSQDGVHYSDASDATSATYTLTDVPSGEYTTLQFTHGIAGSGNVAGAFPTLDAAGMAWPAMMGGGYHYMRNEGTYTPNGGGVANFTTHTGPSMGTDFSFPVSVALPSKMTLGNGETVTIRLAMDVNEWYTGPNMWDFNDYGLIMGNMGAQGLLKANGASVWSATAVN